MTKRITRKSTFWRRLAGGAGRNAALGLLFFVCALFPALAASAQGTEAGPYRYLRLTVLGGVSDSHINIYEINWLVGEVAHPLVRPTGPQTVTASQRSIENTAWRAYDGGISSPSSIWRANTKVFPFSVTIDLGQAGAISPTGIQIRTEANSRAIAAFTCEGSNDNATWTSLFQQSGLTESDWASNAFKDFVFPDTQAPTAPAELSSSAIGADAFTLSWAASTDNVGVVSYEVFAGAESLGTTTATSLALTGLDCGTAYAMTVAAIDAAGNVSARSAALPVNTTECPDTESPTVPTGLASSDISKDGFTLSWAASTDNVGVTSYEVFAGAESVGTTTSTTMTLTDLDCATAFAMTVTATDEAGNVSAASAPLSVSTSACPAPAPEGYRYLRLTALGGTNPQYAVYVTEINWKVGSENYPKTRTTSSSTAVTATLGQSSAWRAYDGVAELPAWNTSGTVYPYSITIDLGEDGAITPTGIEIGAQWNERTMSAFTCEGSNDNSTWTTLYSASDLTIRSWVRDAMKTFDFPNVDNQAPAAPANVTASTITENALTLSWDASTDNVGVASYEVFAGSELKGTTTTTSMVLTGLTCNTPYALTVKAKDAAGNVSAASAPLSVSTAECTTPPAEEGYRYLRLTALGGTNPEYAVYVTEINWLVGSEVYPKVRTGSSSTNVAATVGQASAWRAYDGISELPSWNTGSLIYPYSITLDLGADESIRPTGIQIASQWNGRTMAAFTCEGSNDNSTWTTLYSKSGLVSSNWAGNYAFNTFEFPGSGDPNSDTQAPTAPSGLAVSGVGREAVTLTWNASTDNVGVVSYEVFAGLISKGTTTSTSMSVTGLACNTTYALTVKALDAAGNVSAASSAASVTTTSCSGPSNPNTAALGMNLSTPRAWSSEFFFTNLAHHSLAWMPVETAPVYGTRIPVTDLTPDRYLKPGATGRLVVLWDIPTEFLTTGDYVFTYEGTAEVALSTYSTRGVTSVSNTPGRIVVNMAPTNSKTFVYFDVTSNSEADPIKNISFRELDREFSTDIFRPEFIAEYGSLKAFRFMDWMLANNNTITSWDQYPADNALIQTGGVSFNYMIALANQTNRDAWFTAPVLADDDFFRQMAIKIRDNLKPELKAYIELSNEIWNNSFTQHRQAAEKARERGISNTGNNWEDAPAFTGYRSAEMEVIFKQEFAKKSDAPGMVNLIAWQAANDWHFRNWVIPHYRQVLGSTAVPEAVAIAPYFGGAIGSAANEAEVLTWTPGMITEQLLNNTYASRLSGTAITVANAINYMRTYKAMANTYNIPKLLAYEGGQHLVAVNNNTALINLLADANRDRGMYDAYMAYFDAWKEIGGDLFATFASTASYARSGYWGWKESPSQTRLQAPKYDAILTWNETNSGTDANSSTVISNLKTFGENIRIYPNPASGSVTVEFDKTGDNRLRIYNITGKVFLDEAVSGMEKTLDLRQYDAGLYFFQVNGVTRKVMVR